jgi:hypothetical protein
MRWPKSCASSSGRCATYTEPTRKVTPGQAPLPDRRRERRLRRRDPWGPGRCGPCAACSTPPVAASPRRWRSRPSISTSPARPWCLKQAPPGRLQGAAGAAVPPGGPRPSGHRGCRLAQPHSDRSRTGAAGRSRGLERTQGRNLRPAGPGPNRRQRVADPPDSSRSLSGSGHRLGSGCPNPGRQSAAYVRGGGEAGSRFESRATGRRRHAAAAYGPVNLACSIRLTRRRRCDENSHYRG